MAIKLKVATVDKTTKLHVGSPVTIEQQLNERARANFSTLPGFVPNRFDTAELYDTDGTTLLFGGVITRRGADPFQKVGGSEPYFTKNESGDYFTYFDWAYITLTYASPVTLAVVLADIVAALPGSYGITLDAGQVTGPTLAAFSWQRKRASDCIRELSDRTNYVSTLSPAKALKMFVPGTNAAPYAITDGAPHCLTFDWNDTDQVPANKVTVLCGPSTGSLFYTGTRTTDGVATSWQFDLLGSTDPWAITVGGVPKTVTPVGGGGQYEWDHDTYTLTTGTDGTPGGGLDIVVTYWVNYPFPVVATTGATPVIEAQFAYQDVLEFEQGQEIADGLLTQLNQQPREIQVTSLDTGWEPGQALTVALTARLTATFLITSVRLTLQILKTTARWVYQFSAIENSTYQGSYLDGWRQMLDGSSSVGVSGSSIVPVITVLSSPVYLGGSYTQSVTNPTAKALIQGAVPYVAAGTYTGRLRVNLKARDAGVGVKAIISDGTTDTETSVVTSQTFVDTSVVVPIVSGQTYRVYVQNTATGDAYVGYAQLEAA